MRPQLEGRPRFRAHRIGVGLARCQGNTWHAISGWGPARMVHKQRLNVRIRTGVLAQLMLPIQAGKEQNMSLSRASLYFEHVRRIPYEMPDPLGMTNSKRGTRDVTRSHFEAVQTDTLVHRHHLPYVDENNR
jgi:hypothetical protein